jgi:hypothetical protein
MLFLIFIINLNEWKLKINAFNLNIIKNYIINILIFYLNIKIKHSFFNFFKLSFVSMQSFSLMAYYICLILVSSSYIHNINIFFYSHIYLYIYWTFINSFFMLTYYSLLINYRYSFRLFFEIIINVITFYSCLLCIL